MGTHNWTHHVADHLPTQAHDMTADQISTCPSSSTLVQQPNPISPNGCGVMRIARYGLEIFGSTPLSINLALRDALQNQIDHRLYALHARIDYGMEHILLRRFCEIDDQINVSDF